MAKTAVLPPFASVIAVALLGVAVAPAAPVKAAYAGARFAAAACTVMVALFDAITSPTVAV
jgi:hypothetical protein